MFRATCPFCRRTHNWPDVVAETTVKCPRCARFYNADPDPPPPLPLAKAPAVTLPPEPPQRGENATEPPRPAPPPPGRLLTTPHRCQQCDRPLDRPCDRRRLALPCPHCGRATSILAVLHRCPACDARLESPLSVAGETTPCPACGGQLRVPWDVLADDRGQPEERVFAFRCPACDGRLLASRRAIDLWAVCPHCERPLTVPPVGEPLLDHERYPASVGLTGHCSHCHLEIPRHAVRCPFCQAPDPFKA